MSDESRLRITRAQREVEMVILKAQQRLNQTDENVASITSSGQIAAHRATAQRLLNEAAAQLQKRRAA